MTNKKKMYKYTSIISMAIVLMLIANLILPMFSMADDGNNATSFSMSSALTQTTYKGDDDIDMCRLTFTVTTSYNGSENIKLHTYFTVAKDGGEEPFDIDDMKAALKSEDASTVSGAIARLEEVELDSSIKSEETTIENGNDIEKSFTHTFAATSENNGDYYAVVIARKVTTTEPDGEENEENIGANVCMVSVESNTSDDPNIDPVVEMDSISVKTNPTRNEYTEGEDISLEGGVIEVHYNNGNTEDVDMPGNVTIVSGSPAAIDTPVVISYSKDGVTQEANFNVTVNPATPEKSVSEIAVKTLPSKITYNNGEAIDLTGGVITVNYENGDTEDIDMKDLRVSIIAGLTADANSHSVTLSCGGKTTTFDITVNPATEAEKTVTSIAVKTNPTKTTYNVGDKVDLTGGVITVKYSDGSSEDIEMVNKATVVSSATVDARTSTVTISYAGKETTFNIKVNAEQKASDSGSKNDDAKKASDADSNSGSNQNAAKQSTTTTVDPKKATQSMPQTGANDTAVVIGIVLFSAVGVINFVKYKRA